MWQHTNDHSDLFYERARAVANFCGSPFLAMLRAANAESGVSAKAENPRSSATGIIQWMADKAGRYYGYSRAAFAALPAEEQVEFIREYMRPHRGKLGTAAAIYTAIFLPAFVDRASDPDYVLCARKGHPEERLGWAYAANAIFDANGDGRITVGELELAMERNWVGPRCAEMIVRAGIEDAPTWGTPDPEDLTTTFGIQRVLSRLGFDLGPAGIDGVPGPRTRGAVVAFQRRHRLDPDGFVGPLTRAALLAA